MKIRNGFVSNSSSSSFVIMSTNKIESNDDIYEKFLIPEASPLSSLSYDISRTFFNQSEEMSYEDIVDEYYYGDKELILEDVSLLHEECSWLFSLEELQKIKDEKLFVRYGSVSSDSGEPIDQLIYYGADINIDTEDFKINRKLMEQFTIMFNGKEFKIKSREHELIFFSMWKAISQILPEFIGEEYYAQCNNSFINVNKAINKQKHNHEFFNAFFMKKNIINENTVIFIKPVKACYDWKKKYDKYIFVI